MSTLVSFVRTSLPGLEERLEGNIKKAQFWLDTQVMNDTVPYMPMVTGSFINLTRAKSIAAAGTGLVYVATGDMGRYLYFGKKMVDSATGKGPRKIETSPGQYIFRYKQGAKLIPTNEPLKFVNPMAHAEWFEEAKRNNVISWVENARKIAGTGHL